MMNDFVVTEDILRRFWFFVDKKGEDECWLWMGGCVCPSTVKREDRDKHVYGAFRIGGDMWRAHRVSFVIHHGPIPDNLQVHHCCDVKLCVNPKHLSCGNHLKNAQEAKERGLLRPRIGEKHGKAVMTEKGIAEIRRIYAQGGISQAKLGKSYGVCKETIRDIIKRRIWKHIP